MGLLGADVRIDAEKKGTHSWFLIAVFLLGIGVVGWIAKGLLGVSSEMHDKYPALTGSAVPAPSAEGRAATATFVSPSRDTVAPESVEDFVRGAVALLSIPADESYTALDWAALDKFAGPTFSWKRESGSDVRSGDFGGGIRVTVEGARTMIFSATVVREFEASSELEQKMLDAIEKAFPATVVVRCGSEERASEFERWMRIVPNGAKPVIAEYSFSAGNGGGTERFVVGHASRVTLPELATEAVSGVWTDTCSR